jgi:hypothetical protein
MVFPLWSFPVIFRIPGPSLSQDSGRETLNFLRGKGKAPSSSLPCPFPFPSPGFQIQRLKMSSPAAVKSGSLLTSCSLTSIFLYSPGLLVKDLGLGLFGFFSSHHLSTFPTHPHSCKWNTVSPQRCVPAQSHTFLVPDPDESLCWDLGEKWRFGSSDCRETSVSLFLFLPPQYMYLSGTFPGFSHQNGKTMLLLGAFYK